MLNKAQYQEKAGHSDGQAKDVNERIKLVSEQIPNCYSQVIPKHGNASCFSDWPVLDPGENSKFCWQGKDHELDEIYAQVGFQRGGITSQKIFKSLISGFWIECRTALAYL